MACALALTVLLISLPGCNGKTPSEPKLSCDTPGHICTVVGTGRRAFLGEGAPADQVALYFPIDIMFDSESRLIILDYNNQRVRRLDHDGLVRTIMGTGYEPPYTILYDGTPALETSLHHSFSFVYDAAGNMYLAGNHVPLIFKMTTDYKVYAIAGSDYEGYSGDGGPALGCQLNTPCGVTVPSSGSPIILADTYNNCIRKIADDGTITTIAGDGVSGYSGDGGPATQARFSRPYRVRLDEATGEILVADSTTVRSINAQGIIRTVAGTGVLGYNGDGIPATQAELSTPLDAKRGPDGAVYIADARNNRVRRVDPDTGIITTVVGTGEEGYSGDGGPADQAQLDYPAAVLFDADGNLWISDSYNSVIRKVTKPDAW